MFILLLMIFMHIVDDYYLQKGLLCFMKTKSWWREDKNYKPMYKFDYIVGLLVHSFSWSFMISIPIIFNTPVVLLRSTRIEVIYSIIFFVNMFIHAFVDDLKANRFKTNLIIDQTIHIIQIIITYLIYKILI